MDATQLQQWLNTTQIGEMVYTALVSMLPIVELRGGIPFGVSIGLPLWQAFFAAVAGNLFPAPFIIVYIRRIFQWLRRKSERLNRLVTRVEQRAWGKTETVQRYKFWGLLIFVAIPLPGTGAWTGALIAALLDMRLRDALPAIITGVVIAGLLITALTGGLIHIF